MLQDYFPQPGYVILVFRLAFASWREMEVRGGSCEMHLIFIH